MSEDKAGLVRGYDRERRCWITLPIPCVIRHVIDEDGTASILLMAPSEAGEELTAASGSGAGEPGGAADQQSSRVEKLP